MPLSGKAETQVFLSGQVDTGGHFFFFFKGTTGYRFYYAIETGFKNIKERANRLKRNIVLRSLSGGRDGEV